MSTNKPNTRAVWVTKLVAANYRMVIEKLRMRRWKLTKARQNNRSWPGGVFCMATEKRSTTMLMKSVSQLKFVAACMHDRWININSKPS